jgi:hypothetical protein
LFAAQFTNPAGLRLTVDDNNSPAIRILLPAQQASDPRHQGIVAGTPGDR